MRIREENRNMFLLATVTLCCALIAGTLALFEPVFGPPPERQVADRGPIDTAAPVRVAGSVRVIGAPFVPNINPHER